MLKVLIFFMGLFSMLLLSGCTSTIKVHVFSKYMTDEETKKATFWLQERGYEVRTNDFEFPLGILDSTLVFAPGQISDDEIRPLVDSYNLENGEFLAVRYFGSGKHRFTKDNVGLYIYGSKKPVKSEDFKVLLTVEFVAVQCDNFEFAYLNITDDGFELQIGNDTPEKAEEHIHTGQWEQNDFVVNLYKGEKLWVAMEVRQIEEMTEYGLRKGLSLSPTLMKDNIDSCLFEYTVILK